MSPWRLFIRFTRKPGSDCSIRAKEKQVSRANNFVNRLFVHDSRRHILWRHCLAWFIFLSTKFLEKAYQSEQEFRKTTRYSRPNLKPVFFKISPRFRHLAETKHRVGNSNLFRFTNQWIVLITLFYYYHPVNKPMHLFKSTRIFKLDDLKAKITPKTAPWKCRTQISPKMTNIPDFAQNLP